MAALAVTAASPPPNLDRALQAQLELARQRPTDAGVFNDLGNLLRLAGRMSEAEEAYRRSLELDAEKVSAHYNLALLLARGGDVGGAVSELERVVELDPEHAWAQYQLGALLESKGAEAQALKAYVRAFSLNPELAFPEVNPQVIDNRLLTEALLLAHRTAPTSLQAPNAYEDPSRIAHLLVPSVEEAEEASPEAAAEEGEREGETAANGASQPPPGATGTGGKPPSQRSSGGGGDSIASTSPAPRVLTEDDLEPGSNLGQATPPIGTGQTRGGVRYRTARPTPRTWNWPSPRNQPAQPPAGRDPRAVTPPTPQPRTDRAEPRVIAPVAPGVRPEGTRFRPGQPSTGRLTIEVAPLPGQPASERPG